MSSWLGSLKAAGMAALTMLYSGVQPCRPARSYESREACGVDVQPRVLLWAVPSRRGPNCDWSVQLRGSVTTSGSSAHVQAHVGLVPSPSCRETSRPITITSTSTASRARNWCDRRCRPRAVQRREELADDLWLHRLPVLKGQGSSREALIHLRYTRPRDCDRRSTWARTPL